MKEIHEIKERYDTARIENFGDYEIVSVDKKDLDWLIETVEHYQMKYENTGAMFSRAHMKQRIEDLEKEMELLREYLDREKNQSELLRDRLKHVRDLNNIYTEKYEWALKEIERLKKQVEMYCDI